MSTIEMNIWTVIVLVLIGYFIYWLIKHPSTESTIIALIVAAILIGGTLLWVEHAEISIKWTKKCPWSDPEKPREVMKGKK